LSAMPTSAAARAGMSFTPSPTIATPCPAFPCIAVDIAGSVSGDASCQNEPQCLPLY
jgi:hypothetical protein